jgi:hypothetical protein
LNFIVCFVFLTGVFNQYVKTDITMVYSLQQIVSCIMFNPLTLNPVKLKKLEKNLHKLHQLEQAELNQGYLLTQKKVKVRPDRVNKTVYQPASPAMKWLYKNYDYSQQAPQRDNASGYYKQLTEAHHGLAWMPTPADEPQQFKSVIMPSRRKSAHKFTPHVGIALKKQLVKRYNAQKRVSLLLPPAALFTGSLANVLGSNMLTQALLTQPTFLQYMSVAFSSGLLGSVGTLLLHNQAKKSALSLVTNVRHQSEKNSLLALRALSRLIRRN